MNNSQKKINVILLDDHPLIRESLKIVFKSSEDVNLLAAFGRSCELFQWLKDSHCDVLILDYMLGKDEPDGLTLIRKVRKNYPDIKILLSTAVESAAIIRVAYFLGIRGYVGKREDCAKYPLAVRLIASGGLYFPEALTGDLTKMTIKKNSTNIGDECKQLEVFNGLLTSREKQILFLYLSGVDLNNIAKMINRSVKTVSGHKQRAMYKLGILNDMQLFKFEKDIFR